MTENWVNIVVVAIIGALCGGVLGLYALIAMVGSHRGKEPVSKEKADTRSWSLSELVRRSREEAEQKQWKMLPQSGKIALLAFYGLVAALVAIIYFSPVDMHWPAFLLALFLGYFAVRKVFQNTVAHARQEAKKPEDPSS